MKTHIFLALIILWFIVGCSSGKIEGVKPTTNDDIVTPHEAATIPQPGDIYDEDVLINMQQHIDKTVYRYYKWKGCVPASYDELRSSGFLFSIQRCPYNGEFYTEGDSTSPETPSVFRYYPLSEKTYGFEHIVMKNGVLSKYVYNMDRPDSWENEALIKVTTNYADVKIGALMQYIPDVLKQFYRKHERLPSTPEELFTDFDIVQSGWQKNTQGDFNNAHFEFGVDNEHERYYIKYRYPSGFSHCYSWHVDSFAPTSINISPEDYDLLVNELIFRFKFDEVPPSDTLILNKWFDLDSIEEFYNVIKHE